MERDYKASSLMETLEACCIKFVSLKIAYLLATVAIPPKLHWMTEVPTFFGRLVASGP